MYCQLNSYACEGLQVHGIDVEVSTGKGLPGTVIVGLPGKAIMESKDRVKMALQNAKMPFPRSKVTINLAPGDLKKEGPLYDLPIALGLMVCTEFIPCPKDLDRYAVVGECSLDGCCRPIMGILSIAEKAQKSGHTLVCPKENYKEAQLVEGLEIVPVAHLNDLRAYFCGDISRDELILRDHQEPSSSSPKTITSNKDFSDVKGQNAAKRALLISAAGKHNLIMSGPPGSGKSMLAERYPSILPPLLNHEALEVTKIHSVAGQISNDSPLISERPFRAPHHSISEPALIGGGSDAKPGEISLGHQGVLFLDELPEFKRSTLEVLRQPLESGSISVHRAKRFCEYPAQFTLIAAMNPCPCGYLGSRLRSCRCSSTQTQRYMGKLSGPLLDRIDLHIEVTDQSPSVLRQQNQQPSLSSAELLSQVCAARAIQSERYKNETIEYNGQCRGSLVEKYCPLNRESEDFLLQGMEKMGLSTRAYHKVLIIARTIADLEQKSDIHIDHVCEALNYRLLDRQYRP